MLIHIESGTCPAGWNTHHINTLAVETPYAGQYVVRNKVPWLRAGAPPRFVRATDKDPERNRWVCSICDSQYRHKKDLHWHLQNQECCQGFPEVLMCPVCPDQFTTLSGMFQHIETPRCPASRDTISISILLQALQRNLAKPEIQERLDEIQFKLEPDPERENKLIVRVVDVSEDEKRPEPNMLFSGYLEVCRG